MFNDALNRLRECAKGQRGMRDTCVVRVTDLQDLLDDYTRLGARIRQLAGEAAAKPSRTVSKADLFELFKHFDRYCGDGKPSIPESLGDRLLEEWFAGPGVKLLAQVNGIHTKPFRYLVDEICFDNPESAARFAKSKKAVSGVEFATTPVYAYRPDFAPLPLQDRVRIWILKCFGSEISDHVPERAHRFLEEALELVQAIGCTREEAEIMLDYVFGRPAGETFQEVGGVMITLAALCAAVGTNMALAGEAELARISDPKVMDKIRAKHATKPNSSPLPGVSPE